MLYRVFFRNVETHVEASTFTQAVGLWRVWAAIEYGDDFDGVNDDPEEVQVVGTSPVISFETLGLELNGREPVVTPEGDSPVCSEALIGFLERGCESLGASDYKKAAAEIRHLRAEVVRLGEAKP